MSRLLALAAEADGKKGVEGEVKTDDQSNEVNEFSIGLEEVLEFNDAGFLDGKTRIDVTEEECVDILGLGAHTSALESFFQELEPGNLVGNL